MEVPAPAGREVDRAARSRVGDTVSEGIVDRACSRSAARRRDAYGGGAAATRSGAPRRAADGPRARRAEPPRGDRAGRRPRRRARPGLGPRRLRGRVPRRRPRPRRRARRALRDARRRLPQRRLHPVQGAAARRQGHRRGRDARRRTASSSASRRSTLDALRAWKDGVVGKLTRRPRRDGASAQGRRSSRRGALHRARTCSARRRRTARRRVSFDHAIVAAGSQRRRAAGHPARRPARHGLDRRARARRHPGAPARHRRRDHRPRDGDGLRRARLEGHRRRARRPADPGLRPATSSSRCTSAIEARYEAIHLETQGRARRAARRRAARRLLGRRRRRRSSTACWSPSGAGPTARASASTARA